MDFQEAPPTRPKSPAHNHGHTGDSGLSLPMSRGDVTALATTLSPPPKDVRMTAGSGIGQAVGSRRKWREPDRTSGNRMSPGSARLERVGPD